MTNQPVKRSNQYGTLPVFLTAVILLISNVFANVTFAQEISPDAVCSFRSRLKSNVSILEALDELEHLDGTAEQIAPEITRLILDDDDRVMRAAVRCISKLGNRKNEVTPAVISNLDHHNYLVRAELKRALITVGPTVVPHLRDQLQSTSPRVRCTALSTLNQLTKLDAETLSQLGKDTDPRVQICLAEAWKKHGSTGVKQIIRLLRKSESIAAVGIVKALRFHFVDTEKTVPALADCLSRKDVGVAAATTLQTFGVDAKAAIPLLIKSYPLGYPENTGSFDYRDASEVAIAHIGLPRSSDIAPLQELLSNSSPRVRTLAARTIGQMGPVANQSLGQLKQMLKSAMEKIPQVVEESEMLGDYEREQYLPAQTEEPIAAIWQIDRDTPQLVHSMQSLVSEIGDSVYFENESFLASIAANDLPHLVHLLTNANPNIRLTAVSLFCKLPSDVINFEVLSQIRQLKNEDAARVFQHIVQLKTFKDSEKIEAWILEDFGAKTIKLQEFCKAATMQKFQSPASIKILNDGILSKESYTPRQCLKARAAVANDANAAAELLISAANKNFDLWRTALESFWPSIGPIELVLPFASKCLDDSDVWTKRRAISVLAKIGPAAKASLPKLRELLHAETEAKAEVYDRDVGTVANTAIAIASISGDPTELRNLVETSLSDSSWAGQRLRSELADGLENLGPRADAYFDMIASLVQAENANRFASKSSYLEDRLALLATVGSPRAISLLKKYSKDRDQEIRTLVEGLLRSTQANSANN